MAYSENRNLIENNRFTRSPRIVGAIPQGELEIEAAPSLGQKPDINWLTVIVPSMGMFAVMAGLMLLMPIIMGGNTMYYSPVMFAFSGSMMLISMITTIISYRSQVKRFRWREELRRRKYEDYLAEKRSFLTDKAN